MSKTIPVCTAAIAFSALSAFAQPPRPAPSGQPPSTPPTRTEQAARPEQKTSPDQRFVMDVAKDGMAEVELGKLAAQKASNDQVKQFAQKMVDDHGKANDELKKIASDKNITLPAEPDGKHKSTIDKLSKLSGDQFDKAYTQEMVAGHRKAASAFQKESKSGKDPEVKEFASKTLPTIEEHLKQIEDLNKTVGQVGTSGVKEPEKKKQQQ